MAEYRRQLETAVRAVAFRSATSFSWLGGASSRSAARARRPLGLDAVRRYATAALGARLYESFYCHGGAQSVARLAVGAAADPPRLVGATPFVAALSSANCGTGACEAGWEVRAIGYEADEVLVWRHGLELRARRRECLTESGAELAPGARVTLRLPNEFLSLSPGFYLFQGDAPAAADDAAGTVRVYWHLGPKGAAAFVRSVSTVLNRATPLPFRAKVLRDPALYGRRDAAVLYVGGGDYEAVVGRLAEVRRAVARHLRPGVPAFVKELAPGVGVAEDPGLEHSFGEHRCRLVAEALLAARDEGRHDVGARMRTVEEHFARAGLTLDAPYLNSGSVDRYCVWSHDAHPDKAATR